MTDVLRIQKQSSNLDHSLTKSLPQRNPIISKAQTVLGSEIIEVTKYSKLYDSADMRRVIDAIDEDAGPAGRDETTSLAAMLIGKYRMSGAPNGPVGEKDFKLYAIGLQEAFANFPASIGLQAVDGGTGVPSKSPYWPKPYDIVEFCKKIMDQRRCAKVNALRHIAESKRRAENREDEKEESEEQWQARKARVAKMMQEFHAGIKQVDQQLV